MKKAVVTGAGGFIGFHLVRRLKAEGYWVMGVDLKHPEFDYTSADQFLLRDLRDARAVEGLFEGADEVYALAADMGGMGFIASHHADVLRNNLLINLNSIEEARRAGVGSYFFSSSVCVYADKLQRGLGDAPISEMRAFPANPPEGYGWEKLTAEQLCRHYRDAYGLNTHIARFNNTYGPYGAWLGGREKAPAALCRKVAAAKLTGIHLIEIWGDGEQMRPFIYIDDTLEAVRRLVRSGHPGPMNIGGYGHAMVSINVLAQTIAGIAGIDVELVHIDGPQGVRCRQIDNSLMRQTLGWQPEVSLLDGLTLTYQWVEQQVRAHGIEKMPGVHLEAQWAA